MTSRIRSVTAAAAASAISDSKLAYTIRSIVPSDEKPAASARRAHSTMPGRSTPRTVLGSPIPTSISGSFVRCHGAATASAGGSNVTAWTRSASSAGTGSSRAPSSPATQPPSSAGRTDTPK